MRQKQIMKKFPLGKLIGSFVVGVIISLGISIVFELTIVEKIIIALAPPVVASISAYKTKKTLSKTIQSKRLWSTIGYAIMYGVINYVSEQVFFAWLGITI
ncbi:MAG: hypothetical protein K5790_05640 [Nitrosopumilus sp.]|uniref:hypothetical protein n=1 Tax=Nitrosopumilus sp. TaxID=2024843 RepID=UPI00247C432B|nr:hypothetical protein [Nitrosopumilus sp.]MCV0392762.1 hypothetical protein [Nitrosopumilus sp.]